MSHLLARSVDRLRAAVLFVTLFAASLSGQQQTPSQPPQDARPAAQDQPAAAQPPRFRTEANYVRVDVYPTRDGTPVPDLRMEEFDVLEDGARQTVQAFEHIVISPAGPQTLRAEPSSVRSGEQMAANPRNRVFVFFLDVPHAAVDSSHRIKEPLIRLMDRILGPDDLIAVMTPEMSAAQITFARKTEVVAAMLREGWAWGARGSAMPMDEREREYERCYPMTSDEAARNRIAPVVKKMIDRRRERLVLDALHDLVRYLGGVREERKAIVTVSEGWLLYTPDASIAALRQDSASGEFEPVPGKAPVGVDEFGKLTLNPRRREDGTTGADQTTCDRERMYLASIDNEHYFRDLLDLANRYNASFYPIDPRGLPVFDYPIGPDQPPPLAVDQAHLRTRIETLQVLAENTDGMAVINSNDLDRGLRRIADDLTSYYLLGYYSSNPKLDGGYRRITVRVKRPGVQVRARRGYRAATATEVNASRAAAAAPVPEAVRTANAAIASLARIRPEQAFAVHAVAVRSTAAGSTSLWVAGEVQSSAREYAGGATATIDVNGGASGSTTATLKAGERTFLATVPVKDTADTIIEVRVRLNADGVTTPVTGLVRIEPQRLAPSALLYRRGPATGNRVLPAADFRFSRTERIRLDIPAAPDTAPGAGRFLDRNGQPLPVPVQVSDRTDADGQHWIVADATLSALGAGDYIIEVAYKEAGAERRVQTAVRVTR